MRERVAIVGTGVAGMGAAWQLRHSADITLIDPNLDWTFDKNASLSLSKNTPFHGHTWRGRAVRTMVSGETVWSLS